MPSSFKAPCSPWRVFADFFSTYGVADVGRWHLGTLLFCRQLGTLLASLVHWGQVSLHHVGAYEPDPFAPALHRERSGKCDPVFGRIVGRGFRMGWVAESATRNIASKRDAVSPMGLKRKARPIPELQNGTRFPRGRIVAATLSSAARYSSKISVASSSWVSTT